MNQRRVNKAKPQKPKTPQVSEKAFNEALMEAGGLLKYACKLLGISTTTGWRMLNRYSSCRETIRIAREEALDTAEYGLRYHLEKGQPWAIQFALKMQGRERGYVERQEVDNHTTLSVAELLTVPDEELQRALDQLKAQAK